MDHCDHNSRDLHRQQIVNYSYIHAAQNVADLLPKELTKDKHTKFTKAICLWQWRLWKYRFLCLYGWPSSGYGSTLSLLTFHTRFEDGYYGNYNMFVCLFVCLFVYLFVCLFVYSLASQSVARGGNVARGGSVAYMVYLPDIWLQLG